MPDKTLPCYAVIPITPCSDTCIFTRPTQNLPNWIVFTDDSELSLTHTGTYLIYYYAFSNEIYLSMSILLNSREIPATFDLGYEICGGAVSIVTAVPQTISLRNYSNPQVVFTGFIMITKF